MTTVINVHRKHEIAAIASEDNNLKKLARFFSKDLLDELDKLSANIFAKNERIEEIRLRSGSNVYATVGGMSKKRNEELLYTVSADELAEMFRKMCDGSLYAYGESIVSGYISLGSGIRVGVCGHAAVEQGKILGIYNISALNIRLPDKSIRADDRLLSVIRKYLERGEGVLIYSPPAEGKTSLLRYLTYALSSGEKAMRVALVDTRDELSASLDGRSLTVDVMTGYPQADGIRIATAFMNPQVIICDEIGTQEDALAIAQAQNSGVPLIASAHGTDIRGVLRRRGMSMLHEIGAFGIYVGIRIGSKRGFDYSVSTREEVERGDIGNNSDIPRRCGYSVSFGK